MELINNFNELMKNVKTLDRYLYKKTDPEYSFALELIKMGICFLAIKDGVNNYKFYPSRFIGYKNNTMYDHMNNNEKNGTVTNPVINDIIGHKPLEIPEINMEYSHYCDILGFTPNLKGSFGVNRKFWVVNK